MKKKQVMAILTGFLLGLVGLVIVLDATLVQAGNPNRVGLVIVHGDGQVTERCIEFSESQITGYEVLERSGFDLNTDVTGGVGAAICSIDNEGCTYPQDDCFCQCSGGGTCTFWSYWHLIQGQWQFSQMGAAGYSVSNGDVEGWLWGSGTTQGAAQPPAITFDDICPPLSTATPTSTHTPTQTPLPTNTPEPTDTPTPPKIYHFTTSQVDIDAGQSVTLQWNLSAADVAYLQYDGLEEGVVSPGSKSVSPVKTTVYTLVARNDGGETSAEITITVNSTTAAPSPTMQSNSPTPLSTSVDTALPEPVINFSTTSATLSPGACTQLQWDVENVTAVYLDGVEVDAYGSQQVCPQQTQTYILRAVYPGGERIVPLELVVVEATPMADNSPTGQKVIESTPTTTPLSTVAPTPDATLVSQNILKIRPPKDRTSTDSQTIVKEGWSGWTRLGIWGTLVGGWCLIGAVAMVVFGGIWWVTGRKHKR